MKMRAWDVDEKFWIPPIDCAVNFNGNLLTYDTNADRWALETINYKLSRSTGLKDKNGKEIFEGDIFSDEDGTFQVWWNEKVGVWAISDSDGIAEWLSDYAESYEIIGNIYENPELLTQ